MSWYENYCLAAYLLTADAIFFAKLCYKQHRCEIIHVKCLLALAANLILKLMCEIANAFVYATHLLPVAISSAYGEVIRRI